MFALRGVSRRAVALALAAALAACATPPRVDVGPAAVAAADAPFELSGRLSARHGEAGVAAGFRWRHAPGTDELLLSTPFGQALARLSGGAQGVVLELQDGGVARSGDWESLTREALGVPVPVRGLAWWVRGRPHPASEHVVERDSAGRAAVLRQDGWEIVYGYRDDGARPSRLVLAYPGIEVRLALDSYVESGPRQQ
jgi:outer membrane lipoprotein LolB